MKKTYSIQSYYVDLAKEYYTDRPFWGKLTKPTMVTLKPTLKCVAQCPHCEARLKDFDFPPDTKRVFTIEEYRDLFKTLKSIGTEKITISGGEPLSYRYLTEMIYYASMEGLNVILNTNGWLLRKRKFKEFVEAGLDQVAMSIDSPIPEMHDRLRVLPGLFERATSRMKEIREEWGDRFVLNIRMILHKYTYQDIPKMIDLCQSLDADALSIDMIENDFEKKLFLLNEEEIQNFNQVQKQQIIDKLNQVFFESEELRSNAIAQIQGMFDLDFNPASNFAQGIFWPDDRIKQKCTIPSSFMILEGNGPVLACNPIEYTRNPIVGNILEDSIKDIWNNKAWTEFRENKMDFCRFCPMNMSHMVIFKQQTIEHTVDENLLNLLQKK
ncbi:radical SAM protein [Shimazuella sp. AN120528]|uniref:radical SAM protein n=1 Tax=Shimazuella soli TaxID=1892854 RepID=UPI001F0FB6CA|nr:radical SAM protein [Shimazuella soli]MCH5586335.1 radical SAM protein [Shimazuella soli]